MTLLLRDLFVNLSVMVTVTFLLSQLVDANTGAHRSGFRRFLLFFAAAASGMVVMMFPVRLPNGTILDFRSVAPALAGLYKGLPYGVAVSAPIAAFRYFYLGGPGALGGSINILIAGIVAGALHVGANPFFSPVRHLTVRLAVVFAAANFSFLLISTEMFTKLWAPMTLVHTMGGVVAAMVLASRLQVQQNLSRVLELAHTDHLTGLPNLRSFELALKEQAADQEACLVLLDLDHFKTVNDTYGHPVGDQVLKVVADLIRAQTRASDVVCRYGGEEFAVLLRDCSVERAEQVAERIRTSVAEYRLHVQGQGLVRVTISGGLAKVIAGLEMRQQFAAADQLLYEAKANGRNRIVSAGV